MQSLQRHRLGVRCLPALDAVVIMMEAEQEEEGGGEERILGLFSSPLCPWLSATEGKYTRLSYPKDPGDKRHSI